MSSSTADHIRWGVALAREFTSMPNIKSSLCTGGVDLDCSHLISAASADPALSAQIQAMTTTIEAGIQHSIMNLEFSLDTEKTEAANLRKKVAELQQLVNQLSASLSRIALGGSGGGSARRITSDPDKFTGAEKDIAKRQQEYVNWRSQCNRCFTIDESVFNSELRKITHIAGLLAGDAYHVNRDSFNKVIEHPHDPELWPWHTSNEVFRSLNAQYETLDLSREAKMEFDKLTMAKKPYQNFIAEFNSLAAQCGKTDEQKVDSLELKVSQELANEAAHQINKPDRTNFAAWTTFYQSIWNSLQESQHVNKLRTKQNTFFPTTNLDHRNPAPTPTPPNPAPGPDAMQLDAMRPRPSREECVARGLCFYCKKPGHGRDNCEEKKTNDARFGHTGHATQPQQALTFGAARDGFGNLRGRGGHGNTFNYRNQPQGNDQFNQGYQGNQPVWGQHYPRPVNPRMRAIEHGYVEGEATFTASSTSSIPDTSVFTPPSESASGKE
jgi:hypothetical protein